MGSSLKKFLDAKEDEICNEIISLMVKYNVNCTFINRKFLHLCIIYTNRGIFNPQYKNIKLVTHNISLRITEMYDKDDFMEQVYGFIKCIESGYRACLINNIVDKEILNKCIILLDEFFYDYEKNIIKKVDLIGKFNFLIKRQEIKVIVDNIPAIIILKDENEKWICANRYAEEFYDLDEELYVGKTDKDLSKDNRYIKSSMISRYKRNSWTSNKSYFYEEDIIKNNRKIFLFVTEIPIKFQNGSKIIITIKSDITKSKVAKQKVYESEKTYTKIFENISDAVFICQGNKILYLNKKAMKIVGHNESENVIGKDFNSFIELSPKFIQYGKCNAKKLVYTGEDIVEGGTIKRRSDGKIFDMNMLSIPFLYEDQDAILNIVCDNNTKDSMAKYGKSKSEFMGTISHELRTPLNVILSALQVVGLYDECKDLKEQCKAYKKYYYMIKQNSYRLLRIVNNFLDVNEIEDGMSNLNLTQENIVNIVEDVTMVAAAFIGNKGKNIVFDTDIEEKTMLVDKDGIQKVVLNLLSNAIKFTDKNAKIEVNVHDGNDNIIISVKDNGIGIPQSKQNVIFERFVQLDKTFTREREGSGMGLLIVKMIVKLHNGTITVHSKPGVGSEFVVTLPVLDSRKFENRYRESIIKYSSEEKVNLEFSDLML